MSGCIAVLAHTGDALGRSLVDTWPGGFARLMTPANLASWGLYWSLGAGGSAEAGSRPMNGRAAAIVGVLCLMDTVETRDLPHVAPDDRVYVAAEMTAFLSAWLHASVAPKLNPPSLTSLNGERHLVVWRAHALACGLAAPDYDATSPPDPHSGGDAITITVVGDRTFGGKGAAAAQARALGRAARLPMLSVTFEEAEDGFAFRRASALPDLSDAETIGAVASWFTER